MEKHEKWIIFALIALAVWYMFKKYSTGQTAVVTSTVGGIPNGAPGTTYYPGTSGPNYDSSTLADWLGLGYSGSTVNPTTEPGVSAQTTKSPFTPAQPSDPSPYQVTPINNLKGAGTFTYTGGNVSSPVLRTYPEFAMLRRNASL
jgi:hypothetical protein